MDDRVLRVVVVFVIAFLSGLATGTWWHRGMQSMEQTEAETPAAAVPAPVAPAVSRPEAAEEPPPEATEDPRIAALEAEVARLQERLRASAGQGAREGLGWPPDRPEQFTARGFPRTFDLALSVCRPPAVLVGYDCSEPPCIAKLRVEDGWHSTLMNCGDFGDTFGPSVDLATFGIDCPDASPERVALLAPIDPDWVGGLDEAAYQARLSRRWDAIHDAWICGMP